MKIERNPQQAASKESTKDSAKAILAIRDKDPVYGEVILGSPNIVSSVKGWISTGCWPLDKIIGGGIPLGRIVEIFGAESTGKSTLAITILANAIKQGMLGCFVDMEYSLDPRRATALGLDLNKCYYATPDNMEQVVDYIERKIERVNAIGNGVPLIIVVDTMTAAPTKAELEGTMEDKKQGMAQQARVISASLKRLAGKLSRAQVSLLIVNQIRDKIGVMFGEKTDTTGGKAMKFYATTRIRVSKGNKIFTGAKEETKKSHGIEATAQVVKCKVYQPFGVTKFRIMWKGGIDNAFAVFHYLKDNGVLGEKGKATLPDGTRISEEKFMARFNEEKDFRKEMRGLVKAVES